MGPGWPNALKVIVTSFLPLHILKAVATHPFKSTGHPHIIEATCFKSRPVVSRCLGAESGINRTLSCVFPCPRAWGFADQFRVEFGLNISPESFRCVACESENSNGKLLSDGSPRVALAVTTELGSLFPQDIAL